MPELEPVLDHAALRELRQAAMAHNRQACVALLRLYRHKDLAEQIRPDKPLSPRVERMIAALTAGTGTGKEPAFWEYKRPDGVIVNDAQNDPPGFVNSNSPLNPLNKSPLKLNRKMRRAFTKGLK
jgi:hypothetical protein